MEVRTAENSKSNEKLAQMKSGVVSADRGRRARAKAGVAIERVGMFETSHWFLLSGTLVSQGLHCSTLPLTDSWPVV